MSNRRSKRPRDMTAEERKSYIDKIISGDSYRNSRINGENTVSQANNFIAQANNLNAPSIPTKKVVVQKKELQTHTESTSNLNNAKKATIVSPRIAKIQPQGFKLNPNVNFQPNNLSPTKVNIIPLNPQVLVSAKITN